MNSQRIAAVVIRHLYVWPRGFERFMWSVGWPLISLFTWGLTISYLEANSMVGFSLVSLILGGIIFWSITSRSQLEITICFLEEVWSKNLINMFSTPLNITEFLIAAIILDMIKLVLSASFLTISAFLLYKFNIIAFGVYIPIFLLNLVLFGWTFGFFVIGLIIRFGRSVEELAWSLIAFISPFSCIYYPLSSLPSWAQKIGLFIPTTYVFEEMRRFLFSGEVLWSNLIFSFILNVIYLLASLGFLSVMFEKARETGRLAKLEE